MVLVCVTAFEVHHKIEKQWNNREYVVERLPYPNVPVYVVCPREGEGCTWTLHRNYLLPISPNIEQNKKDAPVAGVEHTSTSAPAPSVGSEPVDAEPSGMATSDTTGNTFWGSPDQPASLKTQHTHKLEPTPIEVPELCIAGRYQPTWHLGCMGWSVYLSSFYIMSVHHFCVKYSVNTLYLFHPMPARHHSL